MNNILITGTPGTGKTTLCQDLMEDLSDYRYINLGEFAKVTPGKKETKVIIR